VIFAILAVSRFLMVLKNEIIIARNCDIHLEHAFAKKSQSGCAIDYLAAWGQSLRTLRFPRQCRPMSALNPLAIKLLRRRERRFVPQADKRTAVVQTERPPVRRSRRNPIRCFGQAAASAAAFCFLRRVSSAITPRPPAKSGSAAGSGVVVASLELTLISMVSPNILA